MTIIKVINRKLLLPTIKYLKVDEFYRFFSKNQFMILMYHGVVEKDGSYFSPTHLHKTQFEQQLKYLKKNFNIVSLKEIFELQRENIKTDKRTIAITFDDGFKNNLYTVLPILEKYKIPATIFICAKCTEPSKINCLWAEIVRVFILSNPHKSFRILNYQFENYREKNTKLYLEDFIKHCETEVRDQFLEELIQKFDLTEKFKKHRNELWELLNKDELIKLSESDLIEIGSHGFMHYNLGLIDIEKAKADILKSKEVLESCIGKKIVSIAYPDGSYSKEIKNFSESIGFKYQLAVNYLFDEDKKDKRILHRLGISSTTTFEANMVMLNKSFNTIGF